MQSSKWGAGDGVFLSIPVLNEIDNIGRLTAAIQEALADRPAYTVLFTDDGSSDGTVEFIERVMRDDARFQMLRRTKTRRGCQRGGALFDAMTWGVTHTVHDVFVEMDGDLSHRASEIPLGLAQLLGADLVIASKYLPGSATVNRPLSRRAVSACCNFAVRLLISRHISDYSNGYRFYTRAVAEMLSRCAFRYTSPIYLTEVLATCLRRGYRVAEFPSTYVGRAEGLSKLRLVDLLKASGAIFEIALRYHGPGLGASPARQAEP